MFIFKKKGKKLKIRQHNFMIKKIPFYFAIKRDFTYSINIIYIRILHYAEYVEMESHREY